MLWRLTACADLHLVGAGGGHPVLPLLHLLPRRLQPPREHHRRRPGTVPRSTTRNPAITKWDIFHYIYAVLHHPAYREKFADNLKRELPRIPFAPISPPSPKPDANSPASTSTTKRSNPGRSNWIENLADPLSYRVEDKMRLNKDKTALTVNPSLTLAGIPPETFEYRLGNRSALEWVIDQYRVTEDPRSGIQLRPQPRRRPPVHRPV